MSFVAVAIGGSALIGGVVSAKSGSKAAKAQQDAADKQSETERYIYDTTRSDYEPYRKQGDAAVRQLGMMYGVGFPEGQSYGDSEAWNQLGLSAGGFQTSPGYQFRVDEARKAIERSASAHGNLRSGATMDAIQRRIQGVASEEYGNYVSRYNDYANRLASLAGIGQTATGAVAAAGQNYANGVGSAYQQAGAARSSSYANTGNAINQGVSGLASAYLYNKGYAGGGQSAAFKSAFGGGI